MPDGRTGSTPKQSSLRDRAEKEPLGVDISDYSDEFCAGFMAGQANGIDTLTEQLRSVMDVAILTHGVGEITELIAWFIAGVVGA